MLFLGLCLVGGGSNVPSVLSLVALRPAAVLLAAAALLLTHRPSDATLRVPALLLAGYTACVGAQLIPLPMALWAVLPGHADLARMLASIGSTEGWRPLSLTPGNTVGSLLATLTAWAVLLAMARLSHRRRRALAGAIIAMAIASTMVALLQVIGGANSVFFLYRGDGAISGLFANRNHEAVFAAATLPLLRVWSAEAPADALVRRTLLGSMLGALLLGTILLTGSRSGLLLAGVGLIAAYAIAPDKTFLSAPSKAGFGVAAARWGVILLPVALPLVLLAVSIAAGRDLSVQRLFGGDYASESRIRSFPTSMSLVRTYFPLGSGFGSFDVVFRMHEPDALLEQTFFNRAHNDYLELAITGGAPVLIVAAAFLVWAGWQACRAFRRPWREPGVLHARGATAVILILALASLSDYPIRTPLVTAIGAIAVCWLAALRRERVGSSDRTSPDDDVLSRRPDRPDAAGSRG